MTSSNQSYMEIIFLSQCRHLFRSARGLSPILEKRRFRALLGVSSTVCSKVWILVQGSLPDSFRPVHLLWALMFLIIYASEHVNRQLTGADEKMFRKWVWMAVRAIADLLIVRTLFSLRAAG